MSSANFSFLFIENSVLPLLSFLGYIFVYSILGSASVYNRRNYRELDFLNLLLNIQDTPLQNHHYSLIYLKERKLYITHKLLYVVFCNMR